MVGMVTSDCRLLILKNLGERRFFDAGHILISGRPFARRLPEFKFWLSCTRGTVTAYLMTFFSVFDVPVFWPVLVLYFCVLFYITMKRQIMHMIKHRYVPWSFGKAKYAAGKGAPKNSK